MNRIRATLAVIGAAVILVLAANTIALAATGQGFLLGKVNSAATQTTLKRTTAGPPLRVVARSTGNAPFSTNARGKVANLNADRIDGLDSTALRTRSFVYAATLPAPTTFAMMVLPVPAGASYLVTYSIQAVDLGTASIQCYIRESTSPSGDHRTGYSSFSASAGAFAPALSGAGVASRTFDGEVAVICESSGDSFSTGGFPMQFTATPTARVHGGAITPIVP